MSDVRHKVFISYHHDDQDEVEQFVETFDHERKVFIARALGIGMEQDIIDSDDTDYVMRRIRELYLGDSTVTILLIGKCTWARRYVDWEIQASLRSGETVTPNGLLGIKLPSYPKRGCRFPNRGFQSPIHTHKMDKQSSREVQVQQDMSLEEEGLCQN